MLPVTTGTYVVRNNLLGVRLETGRPNDNDDDLEYELPTPTPIPIPERKLVPFRKTRLTEQKQNKSSGSDIVWLKNQVASKNHYRNVIFSPDFHQLMKSLYFPEDQWIFNRLMDSLPLHPVNELLTHEYAISGIFLLCAYPKLPGVRCYSYHFMHGHTNRISMKCIPVAHHSTGQVPKTQGPVLQQVQKFLSFEYHYDIGFVQLLEMAFDMFKHAKVKLYFAELKQEWLVRPPILRFQQVKNVDQLTELNHLTRSYTEEHHVYWTFNSQEQSIEIDLQAFSQDWQCLMTTMLRVPTAYPDEVELRFCKKLFPQLKDSIFHIESRKPLYITGMLYTSETAILDIESRHLGMNFWSNSQKPVEQEFHQAEVGRVVYDPEITSEPSPQLRNDLNDLND